MEERLTFSSADVAYLANLCHNCGECLYACQYAPPHEFGIDVPKTFSALRVESYEACAWPSFAARAFRRPWLTTVIAVAVSAIVVAVSVGRGFTARQPLTFYDVISHVRMVTLFGAAGLFAIAALAIGHRRFNMATNALSPASRSSKSAAHAAADVLTLKHLHATGEDCVDAEERRTPWRRWMHHCTFYGFALCFASTTVAAIYHLVFGWIAPYAYTSAPVVLGTLGGLGLLVGPAGLFLVDRSRDSALTAASQRALDAPFVVMLFATSLTGLLLMAWREQPFMPTLLVIHLAFVLALFVTLPYGKFVHGIYRAAALLKFRREETE
jgi:citrate/tricarballylate utilization protein